MSKTKQECVSLYQETSAICKRGFYSLNNHIINLSQVIASSKTETIWFKDDMGLEIPDDVNYGKGIIHMVRDTTLNAAHSYAPNVAVLNFASFKHPGGSWDKGAIAQEEYLCYKSTLHVALTNQTEAYNYQRAHLNRGLYTDSIIYVPHVTTIRDSDFQLTSPWQFNCISAAAVNQLATRRRADVLPIEIKDTMMDRIIRILQVAVLKGVKNIVLGAFGCGVFSNNPNDVAQYFKEILVEENARIYFDNIVFAVPDQKNFNIFKKHLIEGEE